MSIEAMKQALAKFEHLWEIGIDAEYKVELLPEIEALRQAIEQAEKQEPVTTTETACALLRQAHDVLSMSSLPPKRKWVGLTDDEVHKIIDDCTSDEAELEELIDFSIAILAVEAKLKEKND